MTNPLKTHQRRAPRAVRDTKFVNHHTSNSRELPFQNS